MTLEEEIKISACPFCFCSNYPGRYNTDFPSLYKIKLEFPNGHISEDWRVECNNDCCRATGPIGETEEEAAEMWNYVADLQRRIIYGEDDD
jgi:hypothetical protein